MTEEEVKQTQDEELEKLLSGKKYEGLIAAEFEEDKWTADKARRWMRKNKIPKTKRLKRNTGILIYELQESSDVTISPSVASKLLNAGITLRC